MKRDVPLQTARLVNAIDWTGVPAPLVGKASAVCHSAAECDDLVAWFGDPAFCPFRPVLVLVPGAQPIAICGDGYAPAAELRDCAVVAWHRTTEKLQKQGGRIFDFDSLRERAGLMRREDVDAAIREALHERVMRHKASPITDPYRQFVYPNPTGRTLHTVADSQEWKGTRE